MGRARTAGVLAVGVLAGLAAFLVANVSSPPSSRNGISTDPKCLADRYAMHLFRIASR
ncbi:MAG TPA: hypothetical protein VMV08_06120 [Gaiellaceae bacterium]|nr:hypothetical protein [Gaiellaceae bacterium]